MHEGTQSKGIFQMCLTSQSAPGISTQFAIYFSYISVETSSLRVSKLQLKAESATTIQLSWSWPKCKSLDYFFQWTSKPTGSNVPRSTWVGISSFYHSVQGLYRQGQSGKILRFYGTTENLEAFSIVWKKSVFWTKSENYFLLNICVTPNNDCI